MITNLLSRVILSIALILITLFAGIILQRIGKPYNNGVFAIHKISTIVIVVQFIKVIVQQANIYPLNMSSIVLIALATFSMVFLIISGGAMSLNIQHELMHVVHRTSTMVFILSISGLFYAFFQAKT